MKNKKGVALIYIIVVALILVIIGGVAYLGASNEHAMKIAELKKKEEANKSTEQDIEIEEEIANGNEYDLSPEEKAFFDALGADPEIKELMQDEVLVQIAKDLVELINDNLTLDAFKREDARARIRSNIRRLLIQYNYPPVKREGAVDKVIKQAELKYSNN